MPSSVTYFLDISFALFSYISTVIFQYFYAMVRSSRPELFCEKDVLRNFAKFTGKHRSLCFPVNFVKFLRITFL